MTRLVRSVEDFCADVGIGRTSLYKSVKAGHLTIRKIGRRSVITEEDAQAFIRSLPAMGQTLPRTRKEKRPLI